MNMRLGLLLLSFLVEVVVGGGTLTEQHVDFPGTYLLDKTKLLTRVEKKAEVNYEYVLSPSDSWTQFNDMAIQIDLDFPQYVNIKYNIATMTSSPAWFITRLIIDNEQNKQFRVITGMVHYHSNFVVEQVWLSKGKHFVRVEYRTNSNRVIPTNWDWTTAVFKIKYFKL